MFALKNLSTDSSACYETGFFGSGSNDLLLQTMKLALVELRPHMVCLTELNLDELYDMSHLSSIGNKWGDIYENQLEKAMNSKLNSKQKPDYWETLVKPIMKGDIKAKL